MTLDATATCFFGMFEHEVWCPMSGDNFLFRKRRRCCRGLQRLCMVAQSDFEPMIMEITGLVIFNPFSFLIMVLGGGGRKQTFGFIPKL